MKLNRIKVTNIEMTDAIRTAVETEFESLQPMAARFNGAASADVEVGKTTEHHHKGEIFRAEINLSIPGKLLRAEADDKDLYIAIKHAVKHMHTELAKEKDKHDDAKQHGSQE